MLCNIICNSIISHMIIAKLIWYTSMKYEICVKSQFTRIFYNILIVFWSGLIWIFFRWCKQTIYCTLFFPRFHKQNLIKIFWRSFYIQSQTRLQLQLAPSLEHQVAAMLSILVRYNWQQFSVVTSEIAGHDDFKQAVRDKVAEMKSQQKFR